MLSIDQVQALSGLVFGSYLALHSLANCGALWGHEQWDSNFALLRSITRNRVVEGVILCSGAVHGTAAVVKFLRRLKRADEYAMSKKTDGPRDRSGDEGNNTGRKNSETRTVPLRDTLHRYSGYVLLFSFVPHVFGARGQYVLRGFGQLDFVENVFMFRLLGTPFKAYYVLLYSCGLIHGYTGLGKALRLYGPKSLARPLTKPDSFGLRAWAVLAVGLGLGVAAGFNGSLYDVRTLLHDHMDELVATFQKYGPPPIKAVFGSGEPWKHW